MQSSEDMFRTEIANITSEIENRGKQGQRLIVAIAGPPASGKSTLAEALNGRLGEASVLVPMDGFHLDNRILIERDLLQRKGAPETFDAAGFCALVGRIASNEASIVYPVFDRERDLAVAGAGVVETKHSVVILEGNYLLLDRDPWLSARGHYDLTVKLNASLVELERRLVQRWLDHGLDMAAARMRARENDVRNAKEVLTQSTSADLIY